KHFILLIVLLGLGSLVPSCSGTKYEDTSLAKPKNLKEKKSMSTISIRYMIDDVPAAIEFYTTHLGFTIAMDASPAFAAVTRDGVRLLLSGNTSSGRQVLSDGRKPVPGGWNRIHIQVEDLTAEVQRLRDAGLKFRNDDMIT